MFLLGNLKYSINQSSPNLVHSDKYARVAGFVAKVKIFIITVAWSQRGEVEAALFLANFSINFQIVTELLIVLVLVRCDLFLIC